MVHIDENFQTNFL